MKYCSFCGKQINDKTNFCKYCGKFLNNNSINTKNSNNHLFIIIVLVLILAIILVAIYAIKQNNAAKENSSHGQIEQNLTQESTTKIEQQNNIYENKKLSYQEILEQLEKYQAQYWEIIKRNNLLIDQDMEEETQEISKDRDDLSKLFKIVESKIDKGNQYYKKLEIIEKQFENNDSETQYDMNNFAGVYNDTIDGLLNDIYKNIRATIPENDFTNLKLSERKWLKDIESYKVVMNSEELGSMGSMTKAYAIANMRKFRILLLLLYYN